MAFNDHSPSQHEVQFRLMIESVTDYAIFLLDPNGKITTWNAGAEAMKGYKAEEIIGEHFSCLYTPEAQQQNQPDHALQTAAAEGRIEDEGWRVRKDGSRFWANVVITAIRDATGTVMGFGKVTRDLTLRKQAEEEIRISNETLERKVRERTEELAKAHEALEAQNEQFRHMIEGVKDYAIFTLDLEGMVVTWNKGAEQIYGYTEDEVVGRHRSRFFTPEDLALDLPMRELREATAMGRFSEEGWRVRKDGTQFWANGTITAIIDDTGKVQRFVKVVRDLTERKQIEEELRKNMELLRLRDRAIQAVSQGILITDPNLPDNPIIFASHGFEKLSGYPTEEILGKNCRFLQGANTDTDTVAHVRDCLHDGHGCSVEILNYRKDGTQFWNELTIFPLRNGHLSHFVGIQQDVTDRRRLEEQLRHAQKMEAVGQLAGGIAHDFNNLLTVINGYSEMILASLPVADPDRELLAEVCKAGERAGTLTRQLLLFSRQQVTDPRVLDLNAVVSDIEKMIRRLIGEDVLMTVNLAPGLGPIKADLGQIEQVITNLCVNARDAMPEGGKLIIETHNVTLDNEYARTHAAVLPGEYTLLEITDTGTGMDDATKSRIFEPYFTTKAQGKGTGLGLAVVFGIIKQCGGHINVYSELSYGTTFKAYLPQIQDHSAISKSLNGIRLMPKGTETILLVEDENVVRALARHILTACGYSVMEAENGRDAVLLIENYLGPLDLLISDVVMPHLGGRQLAEKIVDLRPGIKTLFLSGYSNDAVITHGVLQAEFAFLQKPFTPSGLAMKVRDVLDERASPAT
jgi:two-component system cell cycle sensor histidine kinase/response regulator CckA